MTDPAPPIASSLASAVRVVGDRWTLLVVRALLDGPLRFGELEAALGDIATNVLATRLRELEGNGLVVAHPYSVRPLRLEYELTARGAELAGVLRMLSSWGASLPEASDAETEGPAGSAKGDAETEKPVHELCGTPFEVRYYCPTCQQVVTDADEVWA